MSRQSFALPFAFARASTILSIVIASLGACSPPDPAPVPGGGPSGRSESSPDETSIGASLVTSCSGTSGEWSGCRGNGCAVCSETTQQYPYYFVNHPLCARNLICDGAFSTCNSNCPAPSNADKEPAAGQCGGTTGQWAGCRGNGCAVCSEKLAAYPYYFLNHPKCVRNDSCGGQFFACNTNCPAPVSADQAPTAGTCNGTTGQWAGCRGNGCSVCAEKVDPAFPNYFKNHPNCLKNTTCGGVFGTCNSNCPAPADADRATPAPQCDGTPGQWAGCRGNGCAVCSELTQSYPYYFVNHPLCAKNLICDAQFGTCNASCPAPTQADRQPAAGQCTGTAGQWAGCRGNGCAVCSEQLANYPFYFLHHPNCVRNDTCGGQFFTCNASCPAPTDAEKQPPAGTCNGTTGQWAGCRGNGCSVCAEKLTAYPKYFVNHPNCVKSTTCAGQFFTCNSNCPAPTDADGAAALPDLTLKPATAFCPSSTELAVSAANKWEAYTDGVRLKPTDSTNVESDWKKPAKYLLSLNAGTHVLAVHAAGTAGGMTGLIANLNMLGLPYGGGLTDANTNWRVLPARATPPSNWKTAPSLAWVAPPVASAACQNFWSQNSTFNTNWKTQVGDTSPTAWVWNQACDSSQVGWQTDNWYRLVIEVRCETGSTTCPEGTACPLRDANGVIQDIGICHAGACGTPSCDNLTSDVDAAGKPVLPASISDLVEGIDPVEEVPDTIVGPVSSATDGIESQGSCPPSVGDTVPAANLAGATSAEAAVDAPIGTWGVSASPRRVQQIVKGLDDPKGPYRAQILAAAQLPVPSWKDPQNPIPGGYVEPASCDGQRTQTDPLAGRDIIFVHGFDPTALIGKQLHADETRASRQWPQDKEDFYSGYYKDLANTYWHDHIARYVTGRNLHNRYLTVAWSSNQRLDVAVSALLTQVGDAMRDGRGVVATDGDARRRTGFCIPNCVVISHSTGGPVTDVAMAVANQTPSLKFIPDHVKTHVAMEGAFGGSPWASIAMTVGQKLNLGGLLGADGQDMCTLTLGMLGGGSCPQLMPDFTRTILADLVPAVSETLWLPLMGQTPVPTLTLTGGHGMLFFPGLKILFPGFDDDTLTSNSTCANPTPAWVGPSGYVASGPLAVYDLYIPFSRGVNYWLDQKLDPWFYDNPGGYAAAGCTPYLSPTGMVQPVQMELGGAFSPLSRIPNHFSFLQSAAGHSIADLSSAPNYSDFGGRSWEEVRVVTKDVVYTTRGNDLRSRDGRDTGVLLRDAVKSMQYEHYHGFHFTVRFHIPFTSKHFSKTFWILKRTYRNMVGQDQKDQADYIYDNVVTQGPAPTSTTTNCVSGNVTVRASGPDTGAGTILIGYSAPDNEGAGGTFVSCNENNDWSAMQVGCGVTAGPTVTTVRVLCDASTFYNGTRKVDHILLNYRDLPSRTVACDGQRTCDVSVPSGGGVDATCVFTQ